MLLNAALQGNAAALGQLLQAYRPLLLLLANRQMPADLRAKGGASDLVQETYVDAVTSFKNFSGHTPAEFGHWLEQTIRHNLCDFCHHFRDTAKRQIGREQPLPSSGLPSGQPGPDAGSASPAVQLMHEEENDLLRHSFARLSDDDRSILEMHHRDQLPFKEIAQQLGCSADAVRQRWVRAVKRWRQLLGKEHGRS